MIQAFKYHLLSSLSLLLHFIGIVGMRLLTVLLGLLIGIQLEKCIGSFGLTAGWILSFIFFAFVMIGLERIYPYLERLDSYANTFKTSPYTAKYGRNYPKPKPEDFGITNNEFKEYNERFQFEYIKIIFTHGLWIGSSICVMMGKIADKYAIIFMGFGAASAILLNYFFEYCNKQISKRHPCFDKMNQYEEALNIYYRIVRENLSI